LGGGMQWRFLAWHGYPRAVLVKALESSDGNARQAAVESLQPEAADMELAYLKAAFGDRLAFHGCISTAGPVAKGAVEETVADCRRIPEIMKPGGGYCFAPTHQLQDNSPTENVVAMYRVAREAGRYG